MPPTGPGRGLGAQQRERRP